MKDVEQKAVEILDKLDALATQYTPEVVDSALGAVTVSAIGNLITGVVLLLIAAGIAWACRRYWEALVEAADEPFVVVFGSLASLAPGVAGTATLLDVWNWVATWNPQLALAHKILGL